MTITETTPPAPLPPPEGQQPDHAPGDREMTMLEHLDELRRRLIACVTAVVVGILVSIIPIPGFDSITHFVVNLLAKRAPAERLLTLGPGEGFFTFLEVSLLIGIALAMPVIIYQLLAFV